MIKLQRQYLWLVLGREPLLSAAEIFAVLGNSRQFFYNPPILKVEAEIDSSDLIKRLGGTIKIGREIKSSLKENELADAIFEELREREGKIIFGISCYKSGSTEENGRLIDKIERLGNSVKGKLKVLGNPVRFVFNKEAVLSSVSVEKNKLIAKGAEILIYEHEAGFDLATTEAVQPFEEFSKRDFGRPGRDDVSGMLPPKLALMMINIAVGHLSFDIYHSAFSILDPFCGSGTILTEAALLGYQNLIGTDISERAITDTRANFNWLAQKNLPPEADPPLAEKSKIKNQKLFQSDVKHLAERLDAHSIDAIVTEPYLGPPLRGRESPEQLKKNCAELAGLYKSAFEQFAIVLKPGATVVFIIPRFTLHDTRYTISDKIMPDLKNLGFEKVRLLPEPISPANYILYQRPHQFVGREIWKFRLVDSNA